MLNLEKIQNTITAEVQKAVLANRKAIISLIKDNLNQLIEDINNLDSLTVEEDDTPTKPAKAKAVKEDTPTKPAKAKAAKEDTPAKPAKAKAVKQEPEEEYSFIQEDIDEVEDEEIELSDYADLTLKELKAEVKARELVLPKEWGQKELAKALILDDESEEDDE